MAASSVLSLPNSFGWSGNFGFGGAAMRANTGTNLRNILQTAKNERGLVKFMGVSIIWKRRLCAMQSSIFSVLLRVRDKQWYSFQNCWACEMTMHRYCWVCTWQNYSLHCCPYQDGHFVVHCGFVGEVADSVIDNTSVLWLVKYCFQMWVP